MVLRTDNGKPVYDGEQIKIGGHETYISVCRKHYFNPMLSNPTIEKGDDEKSMNIYEQLKRLKIATKNLVNS